MVSSILPRHVEPEWLDELAADDPRAVRSRGDLRRVNLVMRHAGLMARMLAISGSAPRTILDLGCGDGTFMLAVARRLAPRWHHVTVRLLDRQNLVTATTLRRFAGLGWRAEAVAADVIEFLDSTKAECDATAANLVLHHFDTAELSLLLRLAARRTRLFVACEPWRARHALAFSRTVWAIGGNDVTQHDAPTSVRAGFRAAELTALWPQHESWQLHEGAVLPFSHRFAAYRP